MKIRLSRAMLLRQNKRFMKTSGRSQENRTSGFSPAFMDTDTLVIYASCITDGRPAPFHLIDGLPDILVAARYSSRRVSALKASVVCGFVRENRFYTRDEAAQCVTAEFV